MREKGKWWHLNNDTKAICFYRWSCWWCSSPPPPVFAGECAMCALVCSCVCKSICVNTPEMSIASLKAHQINSHLYLSDSNLNVVPLKQTDMLEQACIQKEIKHFKKMTESTNDFPKAAALLGARCIPLLVSTDHSEACVCFWPLPCTRMSAVD